MIIKILGTGCANCQKLEENVRKAVAETEKDAAIEKVSDLKDIASYGLIRTPALVVDGEVKSMGKVLSVEEIKKYL